MAKKKAVVRSAGNPEKELYAAFLKRLKSACEAMVEPGFFEQLPAAHLQQLFAQRFPPLKLEFAPGALDKVQETHWQNQFRLRLTDLSVRMPTGGIMPVGDYFREGVLLAGYAETMSKRDRSPILRAITEAYSGGSPLFLQAAEPITGYINSLCVIFSDIRREVFHSDYSGTAILGARDADNKIRIGSGRLVMERVKLDGHSREVVALAWTDMFGKLLPVKIAPTRLGLGDAGNKPLGVYCQQHALNRLAERLAIHPGALLNQLEGMFYDQDQDLRVREGLLPFSIAGKKLGYLVTDLMDDKLVIRTFLFMTNDGTPEGRRLAELTRLKIPDKQYLGIDTLPGLRRLNLAQNPVLQQLFTEAGCADLLHLEGLDPLLQNEVTAKDPDFLLCYLQDSPFMRKRNLARSGSRSAPLRSSP